MAFAVAIYQKDCFTALGGCRGCSCHYMCEQGPCYKQLKESLNCHLSVKTLCDKQDVQMKLTTYEWVAGKKKVEVMDSEVARKAETCCIS